MAQPSALAVLSSDFPGFASFIDSTPWNSSTVKRMLHCFACRRLRLMMCSGKMAFKVVSRVLGRVLVPTHGTEDSSEQLQMVTPPNVSSGPCEIDQSTRERERERSEKWSTVTRHFLLDYCHSALRVTPEEVRSVHELIFISHCFWNFLSME